MTKWRVRATDKLWDQIEYVNKLTPKEGDEVIYVYNTHPKKKQTEYKYIMKGIVRSGIIGDRHKVFPGNIGNVRPHTERNKYIEIEITEVGLYDETEWSWTKNTSKRRTWMELI